MRRLVRDRYDACFDDDRGDMGVGRRGGLWEEMKGELRRMRGRDLHDAGWKEKEQEEGGERRKVFTSRVSV